MENTSSLPQGVKFIVFAALYPALIRPIRSGDIDWNTRAVPDVESSPTVIFEYIQHMSQYNRTAHVYIVVDRDTPADLARAIKKDIPGCSVYRSFKKAAEHAAKNFELSNVIVFPYNIHDVLAVAAAADESTCEVNHNIVQNIAVYLEDQHRIYRNCDELAILDMLKNDMIVQIVDYEPPKWFGSIKTPEAPKQCD